MTPESFIDTFAPMFTTRNEHAELLRALMRPPERRVYSIGDIKIVVVISPLLPEGTWFFEGVKG